MILSDIAIIHREIVNPEKFPDDTIIDHYSLPAFDKGACERVTTSEVKSQKQRVPKGSILVSRLNPHIPRVWAPDVDSDVENLASTEWSVLIPKGVDRGFLQCLFESNRFERDLRAGVTGTSNSHQRVPPQYLMEISVREIESHLEQRASVIPENVSRKVPKLRKQAQLLHRLANHRFNQLIERHEHPKATHNRVLRPRMKGGKGPLRRLGEFISLQKGLSYKSKELSKNEGNLLINLKTIKPDVDVLKTGFKRYTGEYKDRHMVEGGDIVVGNTDITQNWEVLGHPAIVPFDLEGDILYTCDISAVRRKDGCPFGNMTLFQILNHRISRNRSQGWATGTTVQRIPEGALLDIEIELPSQEELDLLESQLEDIYRCIDKIYQAQRTAQELLTANANLTFPKH